MMRSLRTEAINRYL